MTDVTDYEGVFESADGVAFEALYQAETDLFILSAVDEPTDLRTAEPAAFVETVETGRVTPLGAER
jgi:hypothetical protein